MFLVVDTQNGYSFKRFTLNGVKRKLIKLHSEPMGLFGTKLLCTHGDSVYIKNIMALDEDAPESMTSFGRVSHWSVNGRYMVIKY